MKFSIIKEYKFDKDKTVGYLSDFSQYQNEVDKIKLHEETITKNEISSGVDIGAQAEPTPEAAIEATEEEVPQDDAPAEETYSEETPAEEAPVEEAPAKEAATEEKAD